MTAALDPLCLPDGQQEEIWILEAEDQYSMEQETF
jgi:hypothetical protein